MERLPITRGHLGFSDELAHVRCPSRRSLEVVQDEYAAALQRAPVDEDTRRACTSRVRQYLAWLGAAAVDGDPLADPAGRDWAVRDYRAHLQSVAKRKPSTVNTTLAAIADFYMRRGLGPPDVRRLELPQTAPRALTPREATRWLQHRGAFGHETGCSA